METQNLDRTSEDEAAGQDQGAAMEELESQNEQGPGDLDTPDGISSDELKQHEDYEPGDFEEASKSIKDKLSERIRAFWESPYWPNNLAHALARAALLITCILLVISVISIIQAFANGSISFFSWSEEYPKPRISPASVYFSPFQALIWPLVYLAILLLSISLVSALKRQGSNRFYIFAAKASTVGIVINGAFWILRAVNILSFDRAHWDWSWFTPLTGFDVLWEGYEGIFFSHPETIYYALVSKFGEAAVQPYTQEISDTYFFITLYSSFVLFALVSLFNRQGRSELLRSIGWLLLIYILPLIVEPLLLNLDQVLIFIVIIIGIILIVPAAVSEAFIKFLSGATEAATGAAAGAATATVGALTSNSPKRSGSSDYGSKVDSMSSNDNRKILKAPKKKVITIIPKNFDQAKLPMFWTASLDTKPWIVWGPGSADNQYRVLCRKSDMHKYKFIDTDSGEEFIPR